MITDGQRLALAQKVDVDILADVLRSCAKQFSSLVGETEFDTLVNTITFEAQSQLIQSALYTLSELKKGNIHE